jgi:putative ABC transport system permease protein
MIKNFIIIALRNLWRQKIYSSINILGLSLGLTCTLLLFLYVKDELSFDTQLKNHPDIYRLTTHFTIQDKPNNSASTCMPLAEVMQKDYPEVKTTTRILPKGNTFIRLEEKKLNQREIYYADSSFFQVFDYQLLVGDAKTALQKPHTIVLTKTMAEKIFGGYQEAVGKVISLDDQEKGFMVSAVMQDLPSNNHLIINGLISMNSRSLQDRQNQDNWGNYSNYTYVVLKPKVNTANLTNKMKAIFDKYMAKDFAQFNIKGHFGLQAITQIHLYSKLENDIAKVSDASYVYIFSAIAIFIILIASINYMNLATARSLSRAKEVGIRKVLGSYRAQLLGQFMFESIALSLFSLFIALFLVELALPYFNQIAQKQLAVNYFTEPSNLLFFVLISLAVGFLSGTYPAFFLSNFNPVMVLKGKFSRNVSSALFRKTLVVVQFSLSIIMIIGTWIVYQQLNYVQNKDLGFDRSQILVLNLPREVRDKVNVIKDKLLQNPNIQRVGGATATLGTDEPNRQGIRLEQNGQMKEHLITDFFVDTDYLNTMGMKIIKGRNFDKNTPSDTIRSVLVNETLVKAMGWKDNPIGKKMVNLGEAPSLDKIDQAPVRRVVGVIKDFHLVSLHQKIEPVALFLTGNNGFTRPSRLFVKLNTQNLENTLQYVEQTYTSFDTKRPYEPYFLDQTFAKQYESDQKRGQIFLIFSFFIVFIACLGLFGLASYTAEQKTKEIGIRKVLGASIPNILFLLSKQFLLLILLANVIAIPVAIWVMNDWLQDFAYRTELSQNWFIFILAGLLAFAIAALTIGFQAFKAAITNPVDVLRNE